MINNEEYSEFQSLLQEYIQEEVEKILRQEYLFQGITGIITDVNGDNTYTVNIVTTTLYNVKNKTNLELSIGDSVTLLNRYGSNYTDCFIFLKNGEQSTTFKDDINNVKEYIDNNYRVEVCKVSSVNVDSGSYVKFINKYGKTIQISSSYIDESAEDKMSSSYTSTVAILVKNNDYDNCRIISSFMGEEV